MQNLLVCGCHGLRCVAHALLNKHRVVEVAFVHLPHVDDTKGNHERHSHLAVDLLHEHEHQHNGAKRHDEGRAPTVGGEHSHTHVGEVAKDRSEIFGWQRFQRHHLRSRNKVGEEHSWHKCKKHTHAGGHGERHNKIIALLTHEDRERREEDETKHLLLHGLRLLKDLWIVDELLQRHHGEKRYGKLGDDEY